MSRSQPTTSKSAMRMLSGILLCFSGSVCLAQTKCLNTAPEIAPQLSNETRREFETKLAQARENVAKNPTNVENVIWLGRRAAYLGQYKQSISIYTDGIRKFPGDARLYRHRGHRFITLRCFDAAIADFEKAAKLIKGKPDEIEPDGMPNARNIPTSTLQSNIWYHLGLARYLKGDFRGALSAYREADKVSKNADMVVATRHWLYMTLRRLGRANDANETLTTITDNPDIIENGEYYKLIRMYQGKLTPEALRVESESNKTANTTGSATLGYGVGNWAFLQWPHDRGGNSVSTNCRGQSMGEFRLHRRGNRIDSIVPQAIGFEVTSIKQHAGGVRTVHLPKENER